MGVPIEFFLQNGQFVIGMSAAAVVLVVAWLHFDAWLSRREGKELWKWIGFFLLGVSFLIRSTLIEAQFGSNQLFSWLPASLSDAVRFVAYLAIVIGQFVDPLQPIPKTEGLTLEETPSAPKQMGGFISVVKVSLVTTVGLPLLAVISCVQYWRRATKGLERHLLSVAISFLGLSIFEFLTSLQKIHPESVVFEKALAPFGLVWTCANITLLVAVILLGRWVWQYLISRLQSQLFMFFTGAIMVIFMVVTCGFTFLLMRNIVTESLSNLDVSASVLEYALDSKKIETSSSAEAFADNPSVAGALSTNDHTALLALSTDFLSKKKQSTLVVVSAESRVVLRVEEPDRWGDVINNDPLIERSLVGQSGSSVTKKEGVVVPGMEIRSSAPVRKDNLVIGVVVVGVALDDGFVDGIKRSTGLDVTIFGGSSRSATTLVEADGKSRLVGIEERNPEVQATVLEQGKTFRGRVDVLGKPYLAVYAPIKDIDNSVQGMLFLGRTQLSLLETAGASISLTFALAVALFLLAVIPAYFISRSIAYQVS